MLQPLAITEDVAASQEAAQLINQNIQVAQRTAAALANGVPARPAEEARTLPDGRVIPGRAEVPAISAVKLKAAVGIANLNRLTASQDALLGE